MTTEIQHCLQQDDVLDVGKFRVIVKVWIAPDGRTRAEVVQSTGKRTVDDRIREDIGTKCSISEPPPQAMQQPVIMRVGGNEKA